VEVHPDTIRAAKLEKDLRRVAERLRKVEVLLDLQKKVSEILGIELPPAPSLDGDE
jgi:hypothetical protein